MNPLTRTLSFVGVAAVSVVVAATAWYGSQPSDVSGYGDVGKEFFPDFEDVTKATALTVVDFNDDEKEPVSFAVKQNDDGLWVIPSHHNYPAEAEDRLARTATSLLGVEKTAVQSRTKEDWKRYGVVDPAEEGAATAEERGTRLTLSDSSGNPLVDLIVGNKVEGRDSHYYVREPEKNTTYITPLDVDLSAKFSDWIEPDLLKISSTDIVQLTLDNYSIDEQRGTVDKKELLEFAKKDLETAGDWQLVGLDEETEELDKSPVTSIATNLDELKIVGVRPKPEGLGDDLRVNPAVKQILQMQMQAQGFFIGGDKEGKERLYANEGELSAGISNGVEYTLYFGEIARGSEKDIEVGLTDASQPDEEKQKDADDDSSAENTADESEDGPRRYLLVTAGFNESLLGEKPVAPVEPVKPDILKEADKAEEKPEAKPPEADEKKPAAPADADKEAKEEAPAAKPDPPAPETEAAPPEEKKETESADDSCGPQEESGDEPAATEESSAPDETGDAKTETKPADETPKADDKPAAEDGKDQPPPKETEPPADKPAATETAKPTPDQPEPAEQKPADDKPADEKPADAPEKKAEPPAAPAPDPKVVAQQAYDAAVSQYEADKTKYESDLKAYEVKLKEGQEKAEELSRRFAGWYYVISSDSFEKFRITRNDVVSRKEPKDTETPDEKTDSDTK